MLRNLGFIKTSVNNQFTSNLCSQILYRCFEQESFNLYFEDINEGGSSSTPHFLLGFAPNFNSKVPPLIKSS